MALQHSGSQTLEHGTDGFAAFPVFKIQRNEAQKNAREKAFLEALERFTWASWWDHVGFGYHSTELRFHCKLVNEIDSLVKIHRLFALELKHSSKDQHPVILLFAQLQGGGFISAGAAGFVHSRAETELRAISELYRHGAAIMRYRQKGLLPRNRYEERLIAFASGQHDDIVLKRLGSPGNQTLPIPILTIDEEVVHPWSERIVVWRCLFSGQPQFLGGDLNRLCI